MNLASYIALAAVIACVFFAARYIYKQKKKGAGCIGCPYAGSCPSAGKKSGCNKDFESGCENSESGCEKNSEKAVVDETSL